MRRGGHPRAVVVAGVLALLVAACTEQTIEDAPFLEASPDPQGAASDGDGSGEAGTTGGGDDGDGSAEDSDADDGATGGDGAADDPAGDANGPEDGGAELSPVQDDGLVGANAAAYLRGDRPRVVLEIDVQEGARFPDGVVAHVREVLARESSATVEVETGVATETRRDAWTPDQLRAAADETRSIAHDDSTAVLHLLVLRDRYEDDGVLGLAFGSSSAVVFPDQWSDLTTALLSGDRIARAVSTHEVGHLLGLVGLFEPPTSNHEDQEHPGHTTDRDDVMYYAVERDIISQLDGIPVDFGERTRADLAAIREG